MTDYFFPPFRIKQSLGEATIWASDKSPKDAAEDDNAGKSTMFSAGQTRSLAFTAGVSS